MTEKKFNSNKLSSKDSIPPKMLKISLEATAIILQKLLNDSLETGMFPDSLELADITLQKERSSE